jgi:hypothetical protein
VDPTTIEDFKEVITVIINPFLAGVLATIFAELALMFVSSAIIIFRRGKK